MVKQTQDTPPRPTPPKGIREVKDGLPKRPRTVRGTTGGSVPKNWVLGTERKGSSTKSGVEWPRTAREEKLITQRQYDSG